jgi:cell division protein FtsN
MPKDYAGRGRAPTKAKRKRKPAKRVSPKQRVIFHGPSFAVGALVGAAIVILTAYGPELFEVPQVTQNTTATDERAAPALEFDFPDLLKNSQVVADPEPYAVPEELQSTANRSYRIQAASFRNHTDAEQLRARLLLENLPAQTSTSDVSGQVWHRVVVGPFPRRVEAERAMTRLREQGLTAMWMNDRN